MEFVSGAIDAGAPEFFISGVAAAEIIDDCMVRVTLYREVDGTPMVIARLLWTIPAWRDARAKMGDVQKIIEGTTAPSPQEAPRRAHH